MKNTKEDKVEVILLGDSQWDIIEGEFCRINRFTPLVGFMKDGTIASVDNRTPYASVSIECRKFPQKEMTGFITHKLDFANLWKIFKERGVRQDEEVILIWSKKNYKSKFLSLISSFWPKLHIIIFPKGFWESEDSSWDLDLIKFKRDQAKIEEWKWELRK